MKYILTLFILFIGLAVAAILLYARNQEMAKPLSHTPPVLVDVTEDEQALGFPDSRKLAADSKGSLYVAYRKRFKLYETTRYHIFVAKSTDGGASWQVTNGGRPVEEVGDFVQRVPSIAVDAQDVVHVVWYGSDLEFSGANERQIKYAQSTDGGASWSTWRNIAPVMGYEEGTFWQEHPTLHIDRQGVIYITWQGRDGEHGQKSQVKWSRSADGGASWSAWRNISPDPRRSFSRPALLTTPEGLLYALAYVDGQEPMQIVWSSSSDGGGSWTAWAAVAPGVQDQRHFSAVVNGKGRLHLAWRQGVEPANAADTSQIFYTHYNGRAWQTPKPVEPNSSSNERQPPYQFFPTLMVDAQSRIWLAWVETREPSEYPQEKPLSGAVRYTVGSWYGWHTPQTLAQNALYPSLAPSNTQTPMLGWIGVEDDAKPQILFAHLQLQ